jgi:glycosyltransferase involved in cell wall biosynthesis
VSLVVEEYRKYLDELALIGCDVAAIAPGCWYEASRLSKLDKDVITKNYRLYRMNSLLNGHLRYFFYTSPVKIYNIINEFKPDIVHIYHEPFTLMGYEMMRIAKLVRPKPKIIMQSFENIRFRQKHLFGMIEKANMQNMDTLISVPLEGVDVWKWKRYSKKIYTCPIGYDSELFYHRNKLSNKRIKICYVGRIVREKGILDLMEAFYNLQGKYEVELHIIGNGGLRNELIAKFKNENICYHGAISNSKLPEFFSTADILVLPSLTTDTWKEQFGRVLTESMACGVVPIGSTSGEIPNVIGDAGLVFKEGNSLDLQNKIETLLNNNALMSELSNKSAERATKYYSWKKVAEKTRQIYEEVLRE